MFDACRCSAEMPFSFVKNCVHILSTTYIVLCASAALQILSRLLCHIRGRLPGVPHRLRSLQLATCALALHLPIHPLPTLT